MSIKKAISNDPRMVIDYDHYDPFYQPYKRWQVKVPMDLEGGRHVQHIQVFVMAKNKKEAIKNAKKFFRQNFSISLKMAEAYEY